MKKILQVLSNHPSYDNIRIISVLKNINNQLKEYNISVSLIGIDKISADILQAYDVVCFHGCLSLIVYSIINKCKFCLFVDDLMTELPPYNPAKLTPEQIEGLKWCYLNAQSIVCTTQYLSDYLLENYKVKSFACTNLINIEKKENKSDKILYSFGNSHSGDLELINLKTARNVYFFGHCLPLVFTSYFRNLFGGVELYPNKKNIFWVPIQTDYERYQITMNNLDYGVGLIPLQDNNFNKAKSDLKFLEYLQHGAISVCSNVGAVSQIPEDCIVKVKDNDWDSAIEYAFSNRSSIYNNAYKWAMDNRSYYSNSNKWIEAYLEM